MKRTGNASLRPTALARKNYGWAGKEKRGLICSWASDLENVLWSMPIRLTKHWWSCFELCIAHWKCKKWYGRSRRWRKQGSTYKMEASNPLSTVSSWTIDCLTQIPERNQPRSQSSNSGIAKWWSLAIAINVCMFCKLLYPNLGIDGSWDDGSKIPLTDGSTLQSRCIFWLKIRFR